MVRLCSYDPFYPICPQAGHPSSKYSLVLIVSLNIPLSLRSPASRSLLSLSQTSMPRHAGQCNGISLSLVSKLRGDAWLQFYHLEPPEWLSHCWVHPSYSGALESQEKDKTKSGQYQGKRKGIGLY